MQWRSHSLQAQLRLQTTCMNVAAWPGEDQDRHRQERKGEDRTRSHEGQQGPCPLLLSATFHLGMAGGRVWVWTWMWMRMWMLELARRSTGLRPGLGAGGVYNTRVYILCTVYACVRWH